MHLLVFQRVVAEPPAAFSEHGEAAGDTAHIVQLFDGDTIPDLRACDALLVMGGQMDVWQEQANPWLLSEKRVVAIDQASRAFAPAQHERASGALIY
ncbi:hypothetical protein ACOTTU_07400 [Roseobacter sp. EG26]|uniref:hypothetical protein n=1 Tax=Roseobacter sp. EG26 TaxID=3412477 RepID=UPI003CE4BA68